MVKEATSRFFFSFFSFFFFGGKWGCLWRSFFLLMKNRVPKRISANITFRCTVTCMQRLYSLLYPFCFCFSPFLHLYYLFPQIFVYPKSHYLPNKIESKSILSHILVTRKKRLSQDYNWKCDTKLSLTQIKTSFLTYQIR